MNSESFEFEKEQVKKVGKNNRLVKVHTPQNPISPQPNYRGKITIKSVRLS